MDLVFHKIFLDNQIKVLYDEREITRKGETMIVINSINSLAFVGVLVSGVWFSLSFLAWAMCRIAQKPEPTE